MKVNSINQISAHAFKKQKIARENKTYPQNNSISNVYYAHPDLVNFRALFKTKKVDFKKAKTPEQARKFGYDKLGIIRYLNFDDGSLDTMNFINEGLTVARNTSEKSLRTPDYVDMRDLGIAQAEITNRLYPTLFINSKIYPPDKIDDEIFRLFDSMTNDGVILNSSEGYIINPLLSNDETDQFFKGVSDVLNSDYMSLPYDKKIDLYMDLRKIYERTSNLNRFPKDLIVKMLHAGCWGEIEEDKISAFEKGFLEDKEHSNFSQLFEFLAQEDKAKTDFVLDLSRFHTIFHELGHLQSNRYDYYPVVNNYKNSKSYVEELDKWLCDKEKMKAAFKVSPYACYGVGEFIAESYSWLMQGKELPKETLVLYNSLHGPKVQLRRN